MRAMYALLDTLGVWLAILLSLCAGLSKNEVIKGMRKTLKVRNKG